MVSKELERRIEALEEATNDNGGEDDGGDDDSPERMMYNVRYREPAGYGNKWKQRSRFVACDKVQVDGKMVRFLREGAVELAVQQDYMIGYEKKY